jgi:spore coat protein A
MANRRDFLKMCAGAVVGGGTLLSSLQVANAQGCIPLPLPLLPPSPALEPFVDRLPIPLILRPTGSRRLAHHRRKRALYYEVPMMQVSQRLHRDLPPTQVWGYWGMYPGPSFETRRGQPIAVKWINNLPTRHLLHNSIDPTLEEGRPEVRTVVHLHGSRSLPEDDGHPEAWFTPGFAQKGPFPNDGIFYYPNDQPATMLWYHDHAMAITRLNLVAGLAGLYFIREPGEDSLRLPKGRYEIPLVIQDKRFNHDGSIWYPEVGLPPFVHPVWQPDYSGDLGMVNGKVMPFLRVEPRKYRFRILNAANSRFFNLRLWVGEIGQTPGPAFVQIGADVGFLPEPVRMPELLLANAERADVIVDFSRFEGQDIIMANDAPMPFPLDLFPGAAQIMQFRVSRPRHVRRDRSRIPAVLPAAPPLDPNASVRTRDILLSEEMVELNPGPPFCPVRLPTRLLLEGRPFMEPVITEPVAGTTEIWRFINTTAVAHPMHVHLTHMQVLDHQPFDLMKYMDSGQIETSGPPRPPALNEVGAPKDTVRVDVGMITRVIMKFDLPSGTRVAPGQRLQYVHHCHMLEHEDNDMMRPYDVVVPHGYKNQDDDDEDGKDDSRQDRG